MHNTRKVLALLCLTLCMVVFFCACGGDPVATTTAPPVTTTVPPTTAAPTTQPTTAPSTDVTYTATVLDPDGKPLAGVTVQFCDDANVCRLPVVTDAEGKVTVTYPPANYHVSITVVPEGFTADANGYYFEDGETDITITLNAA